MRNGRYHIMNWQVRKEGVRLVELKGDIADEKEGVLSTLLHVGVASTVVEDKTLHELGVGGGLVTHGHDLHHVQVDGLARPADRENGINAHVGHLRNNKKRS